MSEPTKKSTEFQNVIDAGKELLAGLPHFYKCINFDHSHLDADAIVWMNERPGELTKAIENAERR